MWIVSCRDERKSAVKVQEAQRQGNTCLQSLSSTDRCSGVSLWLSFSEPREVLGHFEPGFSRGNSGCLLLNSCLRPASAGEKPLY